ncbi:chloride channel CLIC-like protein 1 isoform X1 [Hyperolius riggenbachi]|uniref:chloride channel CLIC-like protein 1 isoform X1 n=1 Tax=Hyperolius riggenbachi TaxID=752182 RepID=UPI0035A3C1E8
MVSIYNWILNKVLILRNGLVGLREVEPALPHPWSLKSPFERWTIYSKVLLAASIICFITFLILHLGKRTAVSAAALVRRPSAPALKTPVLCERTLLDMWRYYLVLLLILCLFFSVPWEWFRLYKIEVAKKTRVLSEGYARSCYQADQSFWEILKIWMSWNFSWDTGSCESYYKALMVDPFWEVNPLMAISSIVWRLVIHPVDLFSHTIGRSFRNIMKEIPIQWQIPVFLLLPLTCVSILILAYTRRKDFPVEPQRTRPTTRSRKEEVSVTCKTCGDNDCNGTTQKRKRRTNLRVFLARETSAGI